MEDFNIEQFIQQSLGNAEEMGKAIHELMNGRMRELPKAESYIAALDPKKHDIMDTQLRPDKLINIDPDSPDYGSTRSIMTNQDGSVPEHHKLEKVARIALAFQKLIVKRAVGITFGNPVKYKVSTENEQEDALYRAVMRVLKDNKEAPLNRKVARHLYGLTEVAERWYTVEGDTPHTNYSDNPTKMKVKVQVFSPMFGDTLYPYFDDKRDMTAFSRVFTKKDADGKLRTYMETYTADTFYLWSADGDGRNTSTANGWNMCDGYPKVNPYGKIPVIYGYQEEPEYADVQSIIDRLEKLVSNFADTNDYHASPKIVVKGHVNSFCKKGEAGAILELDPDADASYLAWTQAPEAVKTEYNTLKELLHTLTQTPDISWESVKGLNVSGVALELMFMDAILKVKDKEEVWLDYLMRRCNLLKAILAVVDVNTFGEAQTSLCIDPEIVPYIITDAQTRANIELSLTGNKQLKSRKSAMISLGVENVDDEIKAIEEEENEANMFEQNEPTFA